MISIIICSREKELLKAVSYSISQTIGVTYELIVIENSDNQHTILSAYNEGVKRSKHEIICFSHEDIIFYTPNWGSKVISHFSNEETGMIGVSGGLAQSIVPGAWWYNNYFAKSAINILMSANQKAGENLELLNNNPFAQKERTEAVIIDGLWFCIRKNLFEKIHFDENTFQGFHLYDADISMQVGLYSKRYIVYDILLQHLWKGSINAHYFTELEKFALKWEDHLPVQVSGLKEKYAHILGWHTLRNMALDMLHRNIGRENILILIKKYKPALKKNYSSNWFSLYFFLSKYFGYNVINSIFFRFEKITGFAKLPGYTKNKYSPENRTINRK